MTPARKEEVVLYCEDRENGRSALLIESALQTLLRGDVAMAFAASVRPRGSASKSDVQVWTKLKRSEGLRAVGVRDRDFLLRDVSEDARRAAFHESYARVKSWPLRRHCIESYLLEEEVVLAVLPALDGGVFRRIVERCALSRYWLDVARGTVEDLLWRLRNVERRSIEGHPTGRETALSAARMAATQVRESTAEEGADIKLERQFDALAEDMRTDGPLHFRVDGKELIRDVSRALSDAVGMALPRNGLLAALTKQAERQPPVALLNEVRELLTAIPETWRQAE